MRTKKIIICIVFISIFFMLSQSVNATAIINNELKNEEIKNIKEKIVLANTNIKKILSFDSIESLHALAMLIWEILSIFIGHNVISLLLTRLLCCWFVFPIVVVHNLFNTNISGGGFFALIQECLEDFPYEEVFYMFGALALLILPIYCVFVFLVCLIEVISNGIHVEGSILDEIKKDLEYIYTPNHILGSFKPDNNNKSNYTFSKYIKSLDTKNYLYHTGFFGLTISPMILFLLSRHFFNHVQI